MLGPDRGELLLVGWGGTLGAITSACEEARADGQSVSSIHLRHLNPLPPDLGDVLARFDKVLVPELNKGQLCNVIRGKYLVDAKSVSKMSGLPFRTREIDDAIEEARAS